MIKKTNQLTYASPEFTEFPAVYDAIFCTSDGVNDSYSDDDDFILNSDL